MTVSALAAAGSKANERGVKQVAASSLRIGDPLAGAHRQASRAQNEHVIYGDWRTLGQPSQLFENLPIINRNRTRGVPQRAD
jgi:hypothetical protein